MMNDEETHPNDDHEELSPSDDQSGSKKPIDGKNAKQEQKREQHELRKPQDPPPQRQAQKQQRHEGQQGQDLSPDEERRRREQQESNEGDLYYSAPEGIIEQFREFFHRQGMDLTAYDDELLGAIFAEALAETLLKDIDSKPNFPDDPDKPGAPDAPGNDAQEDSDDQDDEKKGLVDPSDDPEKLF